MNSDRLPAASGLIIVAAGSGTRLGNAYGVRKALVCLGGAPLLMHCLQQFAPADLPTVVVAHADDVVHVARLVGPQAFVVEGGRRRQDSVGAGLQALLSHRPETRLVAVHDAARPLATAGLLRRVLQAADRHGCAIPGVPVADTIRRVDADGFGLETPPRHTLRAVQTPQAFDAPRLSALLQEAEQKGVEVTDEATLFEQAGQRVMVVEGEDGNRKITTPADLAWAEAVLAER
jgi:2-C-methyl-D-erythritol 4-phosphate cytidylyltransferase